MAVVNFHPASARVHTEQGSLLDEHPQIQEGVSFSEECEEIAPVEVLPLPHYDDIGIDTSHRKAVEKGERPYGRWWIEEWKTWAGVRFNVGLFEPRKPRTGVKFVKGAALSTQVEGFNTYVGLMVMKMGMRGAVVGPEIDASVPQSESAYTIHTVLDVLDEEGFGSEDEVVVEGYSRGAMLGFGINAYSPKFARDVIYSDLTDPCLARPVTNMTLCERLEYARYLPVEVECALRQLGRLALDPARRRHFHKTIDMSWRGLVQLVQTGRPLMNGEAGFLARHVPQEANMHVRFFKSSLPNQREDFKQALEGRAGVVIEEPTGAHLSGVRADTLENIQMRLSGLLLQLSMGVKRQDLDFSLVHLAAQSASQVA